MFKINTMWALLLFQRLRRRITRYTTLVCTGNNCGAASCTTENCLGDLCGGDGCGADACFIDVIPVIPGV